MDENAKIKVKIATNISAFVISYFATIHSSKTRRIIDSLSVITPQHKHPAQFTHEQNKKNKKEKNISSKQSETSRIKKKVQLIEGIKYKQVGN